MRKSLWLMPAVVAVVAVGLAACSAPERAAEKPPVTDVVVRLSPVSGNPAVAYFTLNSGNDADTLLSITSPQLERVEMHDMVMEGGMMKMTSLDHVTIPANGSVAFASGGKHAMIFGVAPDVRAGGMVNLTFHYAKAMPVTVAAKVEAAGGQ